MRRILYEQPTHRQARGRNNYVQQHGLVIMEGVEGEIYLELVTSRGDSDSARVVIPRAYLGQTIAALAGILLGAAEPARAP